VLNLKKKMSFNLVDFLQRYGFSIKKTSDEQAMPIVNKIIIGAVNFFTNLKSGLFVYTHHSIFTSISRETKIVSLISLFLQRDAGRH
jgi:hypothetical protein